MTKYISFLIAALLVVCSFSCSNDDDETDVTEEEPGYNLVVKNETESEIVIYINNITDTRGFVNNGTVNTGEETIVHDLEAEAPYFIRAVNNGEDLGNFFFELEFSYEDSEEQTIIIDSPQL